MSALIVSVIAAIVTNKEEVRENILARDYCRSLTAELGHLDSAIGWEQQRVEQAGGRAMTLDHSSRLESVRKQLETEKAHACR